MSPMVWQARSVCPTQRLIDRDFWPYTGPVGPGRVSPEELEGQHGCRVPSRPSDRQSEPTTVEPDPANTGTGSCSSSSSPLPSRTQGSGHRVLRHAFLNPGFRASVSDVCGPRFRPATSCLPTFVIGPFGPGRFAPINSSSSQTTWQTRASCRKGFGPGRR